MTDISATSPSYKRERALSTIDAPGNVRTTVFEVDCRSACGDVGEITEMEDLPLHINTVGVLEPRHSKVAMRTYDESTAPAKVFEFSDVSCPEVIRAICSKQVPGWHVYPPETLHIAQICEGLSNQLFKVSLPDSLRSKTGSVESMESCISHRPTNQCVLFRVYGNEVSSFYNPNYELQVFKMLSDYRIAPQLIASGTGWRIEEWHFAVAVPTRLMGNPSIMCQVASQLGRLHKLHMRHDFPRSFPVEPAVSVRMRTWAEEALKVKFNIPDQQRKLDNLRVRDLVKEVDWLLNFLVSDETARRVKGQGLDLVFCHNDTQENNILQTQYGLRLIDFEYAHFNYQAYDIANFFVEFTMDYTEKYYPFFSTDLSAFPNEELQRLFAGVYLSEYLETTVRTDDDYYVLPLLQTVRKFALASHLQWGLWSIVRARQAPTFDEFDFLLYAQWRFDTYFRMKDALLSDDFSGRGPLTSLTRRSSIVRKGFEDVMVPTHAVNSSTGASSTFSNYVPVPQPMPMMMSYPPPPAPEQKDNPWKTATLVSGALFAGAVASRVYEALRRQ